MYFLFVVKCRTTWIKPHLIAFHFSKHPYIYANTTFFWGSLGSRRGVAKTMTIGGIAPKTRVMTWGWWWWWQWQWPDHDDDDCGNRWDSQVAQPTCTWKTSKSVLRSLNDEPPAKVRRSPSRREDGIEFWCGNLRRNTDGGLLSEEPM